MKLPKSIKVVLDDLGLEGDELSKVKDYLAGQDDLPEDPSEREAKRIVRNAQKEVADSDSKIIRQKAPKKKEKADDEEEEVKPKKKEKKDDEEEVTEARRLSFKAFLAEQA